MLSTDIGQRIRRARLANGLTQAKLAQLAGVSRTTLIQLERGLIKELGFRKIQAILDHIGLSLAVEPVTHKPVDFVKLAATMASTSYRDPLTENQLVHALLTGRVPAGRRPNLRHLLEEAQPALVQGLLRQIGGGTASARVEKNIHALSDALGIAPEREARWKIPG